MENIFSPAESFICSSFYLFLVRYVFPKLYNFYIFWLITNFNFSALCLSMPLTMLLLASGGTPDEGIFCLPDQRWAHFGSWTFIEECGLPGQSHAWSYQIKLAEICKKEHFLKKKTKKKILTCDTELLKHIAMKRICKTITGTTSLKRKLFNMQ